MDLFPMYGFTKGCVFFVLFFCTGKRKMWLSIVWSKTIQYATFFHYYPSVEMRADATSIVLAPWSPLPSTGYLAELKTAPWRTAIDTKPLFSSSMHWISASCRSFCLECYNWSLNSFMTSEDKQIRAVPGPDGTKFHGCVPHTLPPQQCHHHLPPLMRIESWCRRDRATNPGAPWWQSHWCHRF